MNLNLDGLKVDDEVRIVLLRQTLEGCMLMAKVSDSPTWNKAANDIQEVLEATK